MVYGYGPDNDLSYFPYKINVPAEPKKYHIRGIFLNILAFDQRP